MARSGWFRGSPPPVRADQVPETVKGYLDAANLPSWVEVYKEQAFPVEVGKVSPPWGRISIWLRSETSLVFAAGPPPEGQCKISFIVQAEVAGDPESRSGWDYLRSMADLHDRIFGAVNGRRIAENWREERIGEATFVTKDVLPVYFVEMSQEAPVYDDRNNVWAQAALYRCALVRKLKE